MENSTFYITSDKVGDFCQRMHEAGLDVHLNSGCIWVFFGGDSLPQSIHIASQRNYEEMVQDIIKKKEEME